MPGAVKLPGWAASFRQVAKVFMHDDDDHKAATLLDYVRFLRRNRSFALLFLGEVTINMPSRFHQSCSCPADAQVAVCLIRASSGAHFPAGTHLAQSAMWHISDGRITVSLEGTPALCRAWKLTRMHIRLRSLGTLLVHVDHEAASAMLTIW